MTRTLLLAGSEMGDEPVDWVEALHTLTVAACGGREQEVLTAPLEEGLRQLPTAEVVIACGSQGPLTGAQDDALCDFVRGGGGLVCLGPAARLWNTSALCRNVLGVAVDGLTPPTELVLRVANDHDITRRLDTSITLEESCNLLYEAPEDAEVLLRMSWQHTTVPVALLRRCEAGVAIYLGLSMAPSTLTHPALRQLLFRALRYTSGWREARPVRIALLGYGAIGFEHA